MKLWRLKNVRLNQLQKQISNSSLNAQPPATILKTLLAAVLIPSSMIELMFELVVVFA
jgi:hypothetical protein